MYQNRLKQLVFCGVATSLIFSLQGCDYFSDKKDEKTEQSQTSTESIESSVYQVIAKEYPATLSFPAKIEGGKIIEIRALTEGSISKLNFTEGSLVKAGQLLAELDSRPQEIALENAQAILEQEQARLENAKKNFESLKSFSLEKEDNSQKELDDAVTYLQLAESAVKGANARLKDAQLQVEYTKIKAPSAGIINKVLKSEGAMVSPQDNILTSITQLDPVKASFQISPEQLAKYKQQIDSKQLELPEGNIFDVEVFVDNKSYEAITKFSFPETAVPNAQNMISLSLELNNGKSIFKQNQSITINLKGAKFNKAMIISTKAIIDNISNKIVYTFNSATQKAEKKVIQVVGQQNDLSYISDGLNIGDQVILDNLSKINEKTTIKIKSKNL